MDTPRRVRIFKNGRNQAIRIPRELEIDAAEATYVRRASASSSSRSRVHRYSSSSPPGSLKVRIPDIPDVPAEPVEL